MIAAVTYLLLRFFDDVVARLFAPRGWIGRLLTVVLSLRLSTVNQLGVVASAVVQVVIVVAAFSLALTIPAGVAVVSGVPAAAPVSTATLP